MLQTLDEETSKRLYVKGFHDTFKHRLESCKLFLCDEFSYDNHGYLLGDLRDDQNCVLFASAKNETLDSSYQHIHLGASLRSSCKIVQFADRLLKSGRLQNLELECKPAHNFEGVTPDIRILSRSADDSEADKLQIFIEEAVSTIVEYAEQSRGLDRIPVIPFIDMESNQRVLEELEARGLECCSSNFSHNVRETDDGSERDSSTTLTNSSVPTICFFEEADIEGAEFRIVVLLMRHKNPGDIRVGLGRKFFTAVTRASTKLVIVISEGASNESRSCNNIANNIVNRDSLSKILKEKITARTPTLLVGPLTLFEGFRFIPEICWPTGIPKINGIKCFSGPNEEIILQIDDVFKIEDLEALQTFGIRLLVLLNDNSDSKLRCKFFESTYQCIRAFTKDCKNAFKVCNLMINYADLREELQSLETFLYKQKTNDFLNLSIQRRPFEAPLPKEDLFSWQNWKLKGHEHYRLGHKLLAADKLMVSIVVLETKYRKYLSQCQVEWAVQARKELAKLCTNVSMMYLKHLRSQSKCTLHQEVTATFNECIVSAFYHAIKATRLNRCWQKSYERIRDAIAMTKKLSASTEQNRTTTNERAVLQELVKKDLSRKGAHEMKFDPSFLTDGRNDIVEAAREKRSYELTIKIDENCRGETIDEIVAKRRLLSRMYVAVGRTSLDLIKSNTNPARDINFKLAHQETINLFSLCCRFAIEALNWNPFEMSAKTLIAQSLTRIENSVNRLEHIASEMNEANLLPAIVLEDIARS